MLQTSSKGVQNSTQLGGKGELQQIVYEIKIWPYYQMVYAQTRIIPGELDAWNSLGF